MTKIILAVCILANALSISSAWSFSDDFTSNASLENWFRLSETEGYGNHIETLALDGSGHLLMSPHTTTWFQNYKGPLMYQNVSGDFVLTSALSVGNRAGDSFPSSDYSLAGIMIRSATEMTSMDNWQPGTENYVFLSIGRTGNVGWAPPGATAPHLEVKTTVNSVSQLEVTTINASDTVELRVVRDGTDIICLYRVAGQSWQVVRRYVRADFPESLQVGIVTYTDYRKAATYSPAFQMANVLTEDLSPDPSTQPQMDFNPDLVASFDYVHIFDDEALFTSQNVSALSDQNLIQLLDQNIEITFDDSVNDNDDGINPEPDDSSASCAPEWPIQQSANLVAIGNSFIGNNGGICAFFSAIQQSSGLNFNVTADCDIRYGAYLREMFFDTPEWNQPLNVIADAESGEYDYAMFISDVLGDPLADENGEKGLIAFDELYDQNCMQSIVFMTWNWLNPTGTLIAGLEEYRAQIVELAQRMRTMETDHGAKVVPYGVILYNLTMNPPPSLAHLPIDYMYEQNGNIHDNALGAWVKANAMYASLFNLDPTGLSFDAGPVSGSQINTPATAQIQFTQQVQIELQQRVWEIVQQWNAGEDIEQIIETVSGQNPPPDDPPTATLYQLEVSNGVGDGNYAFGETVVIQADGAPAGMQFSHWAGADNLIEDVNSATTQLSMPQQSTSIEAVYVITPSGGAGDYQYLRFEVTSISGNEQLHLREASWVGEDGQALVAPLNSNVTSGAELTTNYPANFSFRAFDGDVSTNFYLDGRDTSAAELPIHFTLSLTQAASPSAIRISYPMWSPTLSGLRLLGSNDGESWEVLLDLSGININDYLLGEPAAINTAEFPF